MHHLHQHMCWLTKEGAIAVFSSLFQRAQHPLEPLLVIPCLPLGPILLHFTLHPAHIVRMNDLCIRAIRIGIATGYTHPWGHQGRQLL